MGLGIVLAAYGPEITGDGAKYKLTSQLIQDLKRLKPAIIAHLKDEDYPFWGPFDAPAEDGPHEKIGACRNYIKLNNIIHDTNRRQLMELLDTAIKQAEQKHAREAQGQQTLGEW